MCAVVARCDSGLYRKPDIVKAASTCAQLLLDVILASAGNLTLSRLHLQAQMLLDVILGSAGNGHQDLAGCPGFA